MRIPPAAVVITSGLLSRDQTPKTTTECFHGAHGTGRKRETVDLTAAWLDDRLHKLQLSCLSVVEPGFQYGRHPLFSTKLRLYDYLPPKATQEKVLTTKLSSLEYTAVTLVSWTKIKFKKKEKKKNHMKSTTELYFTGLH